MDTRKEANCNHDLVYLLMEGDRDNVGRCVQCNEPVNLKVGYVKHPHLRYEADGQYNPVYEKKAPDQHYLVLTRPEADTGALISFLEEHYGNVHSDEYQKILTIECTEEDGERLCADNKNKTSDSPLNSIMLLNKRKGED